MGDGAHIGVGAGRALDTILGGAEQPDDEERQTAEEMRAEIMALTENPNTYDGTAKWTAKFILDWLLANPGRAQEPTETVYDWNGDPDHGADGMKPEFTKAVGWYDLMKRDGVDLADLGLSGFMWGWAVNAARRCLELPAVANPAIIDV